MNFTLTIVAYHYARELKHSRYPEIKGLTTAQFREQIAYIKKHYTVISGDDLLASLNLGEALPPQALLLTFDDGYIDHFTQVFPILDQENLSGCFFPPARCILENKVLDVNKIHFILASVPDKQILIDHIFKCLNDYRSEHQLPDNNYFWNEFARPNRFDSREVVFIKRILQRGLPESLREIIVDSLFCKYVSSNEAAFAKELYLSVEQIQCMRRNGMYIGSHSYSHSWLNSIDRPAQEQEIDRSLKFLRKIGTPLHSWIMCYPYGAYNDSLLSVLSSRGCRVGLTLNVGIANLRRDNGLTLPRIDTNDLPKAADAPPNQWTLEAGERLQFEQERQKV